VLRHCLPASIRQTLDHLPESLDDTYLHVLRQIPQANQAHAHRMLQCLMVAVRPLRVEELAEVLAFKFDEAQGGIPKYRAAWQLDDQTQAVLSTCSSLVTIVNEGWYGLRVVQFSHFSVKEFLMSNRLGDFSRYHIYPISAHTILTQACLGVLLHLDDNGDTKSVQGLPLAKYAAQHWVEHAQFQSVASRVKGGMETLFDSDKPHFAAWVRIYDVDHGYGRSSQEIPNPLYYSVCCGFYDLVKHLAVKCPAQVNAICGLHMFLLFAAIENGRVDVVEFLLEHGANIDARGTTGQTILHKVLSRSQRDLVGIVKFLLKHGADVNVQDDALQSPLHLAEVRCELEVVQILVDHKADVNLQDINGKTPLHILSGMYNEDVPNHALFLLGHGAEVDGRDVCNQTPLLLAMESGRFLLARILLEHGADPKATDHNGMGPLHLLSDWIYNEDNILTYWRMLLTYGAEMNIQDRDNRTPFHLAMIRGRFQIAHSLAKYYGADTNMQTKDGKTPLHLLADGHHGDNEEDILDFALLLLKHGAELNIRDKNNKTPLLLAMEHGRFKFAQILLENGVDASGKNRNGETLLHILAEHQIYHTTDVNGFFTHSKLCLKNGEEVNKGYKNNKTPLLLLKKGTGIDKFPWHLQQYSV
jgi:ankyrin repeat protein